MLYLLCSLDRPILEAKPPVPPTIPKNNIPGVAKRRPSALKAIEAHTKEKISYQSKVTAAKTRLAATSASLKSAETKLQESEWTLHKHNLGAVPLSTTKRKSRLFFCPHYELTKD